MPNTAPDPKNTELEGISYFKEMLGHPVSLVGGMGSVIAGVGVLVVTGTFSFALVPALLYLGASALAALFIPSSPVFREYINRGKRAQARDEERDLLIAELQQRFRLDDWGDVRNDSYNLSSYWDRYQRMLTHLASLKQLASTRDNSITYQAVERLDQASLDFLRLLYTKLIIVERLRNSNGKELAGQLRNLQEQIDGAESALERRRLEAAKAELERVQNRSSRMRVKDSTTVAAMISISDTFEEVYERIVSSPTSGVTETLLEAEDRLNVEEEMELEADEEIDNLVKRRLGARTTTT